jgi:hypothetical protein
MHVFMKAEIVTVKRDCGIDIIDNVTDLNYGHSFYSIFLSFLRDGLAHLVKPPLKISALEAVAAQADGSLVGISGSLALVCPSQQIGARGVIGIIAIGLIFNL